MFALPRISMDQSGSSWNADDNPLGDDDELRICALQVLPRQPEESLLDSTNRCIQLLRQAAKASSEKPLDLLILPELCPVGYSEATFRDYLPTTTDRHCEYQAMDQKMSQTARELDAYLCYGTIGWDQQQLNQADHGSDVDLAQQIDLMIRQVVLDRMGNVVATYDKTFLCDYGACAETRFFTPGPGRPVTFTVEPLSSTTREEAPSSTDGGGVRPSPSEWRVGLLICADMRNPSFCRRLGRAGADVLVQPAAFFRDVSFATWQAFCVTRAVENACYFCGINYAGPTYGQSTVVPPWVDEKNEPVVLGTDEGWLVQGLRRSVLNRARTDFPFYRQLLAEVEDDNVGVGARDNCH